MTHSEIQVEIDYSTGIPHKKKQFVASSYKLELARFSTLLRIQDRAKCSKKGGGHRTENRYTGRGGHRTYLIEVGTLHLAYWGGDTAHALLGWGHRTCLIGVGTPHIAYWGGDTAQH